VLTAAIEEIAARALRACTSGQRGLRDAASGRTDQPGELIFI